MTHTIAVLLSLLLGATSAAGAPASKAYPISEPNPDADQYVAEDLGLTIKERAQVRTILAKRRAAHLQELVRYAKAGDFPRNTDIPGLGFVFVDADGRLCAVANLISKDGKHDLVVRQSREDNAIQIADVKDGALMSWILTSGFTQAELAVIQVPDMQVIDDTRFRDLENKRIRAHIAATKLQLEKNESASLGAAMDALAEMPFLARGLLAEADPPAPKASRLAPRPSPLSDAELKKVRAELAKRRAQHMKVLVAYSKAAAFPSNFDVPGKGFVFMDGDGNLCAVANLISKDGEHDLVVRQSREDNAIQVADVTSGALMSWILTSGFTQAELALIQEPDMQVIDEPDFRRLEIARLQAHIASTALQLKKNRKASLDAAVDALKDTPWLARQIING